MWKRKEEDYTLKPAVTPPSSTELAKEGIPMSTTPIRSFDSEAPRGAAATIGKSVVVKGDIFSREDLLVDGEVEGTLELQENRLTVGPNGRLKASVKAREVVVLGTIHGNVEASEKIEIRKDAKLVGDIKTARIVIEDGAYFKGSIDILKPETAKPAAAPRPQPEPAVQKPVQQPLSTTAAEAKR